MKIENTHRGSKAEYDDDGMEVFPVTYSPVRAGIFNLYLHGPIVSASQFIPHIEAFQAAGENDIVVIHLSSPGGSLDATDTFLTAMHNCEGRVIVNATGGCHSAASVILMHAPEFTVSDSFNCLIHNGSFGAWGKYSDAVAQARHSQVYMERVMRKSYEGFLTPEEIDALIEGKDYWLDAEEFCRRYEARNEYMGDKMQSIQTALGDLNIEYIPELENEPIEVTPRPVSRKRKK